MRAISNVHAGRIWPAGCRFHTPDLKVPEYSESLCRILFRNNCALVKRYASMYIPLGSAGADISALQHDFCDYSLTIQAASTLKTL